MSSSARTTAHAPLGLLLPLLATVVLYFVARALLAAGPSEPALRWMLAAVPAAAGGWLVIAAIRRHRRQGDELDQRIALETLASAYPAALVVVMTLGFLDTAGVIRPDAHDYWFVMLPVYFAARWLAARRYS